MGTSRTSRTAYLDRGSAGQRYNTDAPDLMLAGTRHGLHDFGYVAHESELLHVTATDLRHALVDPLAQDDRLQVSSVDLQYFDDDDNTPLTAVDFSLNARGELVLTVISSSDFDSDDDGELTRHVSALAAPLLRRHRISLESACFNDRYVGPPPAVVELMLRPTSTRGRTLAELFDAANELQELLETVSGAQLSRGPVLELLRAGRGAVLLGQHEGQWLDVKSQLYDVKSDAGKIALAQAVARFVNSDGGIVVFGMSTRKVGPGEVINKLRPVPADVKTVRQYRQALEQRIYPLPQGLDVELVDVAGGHLLVIHTPPQPEQSKPFLVHGAIVGDKVEGAFISIVRRSGEDSVPITASAIHSAMSLSRLLEKLSGESSA